MKVYGTYQFDTWEFLSVDNITIRVIDNEQLNYVDGKVFEYSRHFHSAPDCEMNDKQIVIAVCTAWNKWFRARILAYNERLNMAKLFAIDYGHELNLPKQCVYPLYNKELAKIEPVRPVRIGIHGIKRCTPPEMAKAEKISVKTFLNDSAVNVFQCLDAKDDYFLGDVICSKKKYLSDMLVDMGFAVRTNNESYACEVSGSGGSTTVSSLSDFSLNDSLESSISLDRTSGNAYSSTASSTGAMSGVRNILLIAAADKYKPNELSTKILSSTKLESTTSGSCDTSLTDSDISISHDQNGSVGAIDVMNEPSANAKARLNWLNANKPRSSQSDVPTSGNQLLDTGYETASIEPFNGSTGSEVELQKKSSPENELIEVVHDLKLSPDLPKDETPDDELSDDDTIGNSDTDPQETAAGYDSDESRIKYFDFSHNTDDASSLCTEGDIREDIWAYKAIDKQVNELRDAETNVLSNDSGPLKELSLMDTRTMCIGAEENNLDQSKCYDNLEPSIATQLKEINKTYRLQAVAWPHLSKGRSAIIIDPSDNLADLVYLPVICTRVQKTVRRARHVGPLAIIVCKSQKRCIDIAKRCLSFSPGGYMANSSICHSNESSSYVPDTKFKRCKIFVTSFEYYFQFGLERFKQWCKSVECIAFDDMDTVHYNLFQDILRIKGKFPEQIIVTSRFWGPVHREIYNERIRDCLIFGAPLDIAIAANTKFDVLFANRENMFEPTALKYKLGLILAKVAKIPNERFLIICQEPEDVAEIKEELKMDGIGCKCVFRFGKDEYYQFYWAGNSVYYCVSRMLPVINLSNISKYFILNVFTDAANRPEIQHMVNVFKSILRPNINEFSLPAPVSIAFFCFNDAKFETCLLAGSFSSYQRTMQCPEFWAHVSSMNISPFAQDLCSDTGIYLNPKYRKFDRRLSDIGDIEWSNKIIIKFQILHFYSPVHFKVEIHAQRSFNEDKWIHMKSHSKIVDVYLDDLSPRVIANSWLPDTFRRIFGRMDGPNGCFECYEAMPIVTLKDILFIKQMKLASRQRYHNNVFPNGKVSFLMLFKPVHPVHAMLLNSNK